MDVFNQHHFVNNLSSLVKKDKAQNQSSIRQEPLLLLKHFATSDFQAF